MTKPLQPKVVYNPELCPDLREYGIEIPVLSDRKHVCFEGLLADELIKKNQSAWHVSKVPSPVTFEDVAAVHDPEFAKDLYNENVKKRVEDAFELFDEMGRPNRYNPSNAVKPLSMLADSVLRQCGATRLAAELALEFGFGFFLGGGMHHARYETGAGFCLVHDMMIAVKSLQRAGRIKRAWFIDVDAHKGDGTAALTQGNNEIVTLSIHMAKGWPLNMPRTLADGRPNPSFLPSTVDIEIEKENQAVYLTELKKGLEKLAKIAPDPDLVFVVNGSDPYEKDVLPSANELSLSLETLLDRDKMVFEFVKQRHIPQAWVLGGGYGPEVWRVHHQILKYVLRQALS